MDKIEELQRKPESYRKKILVISMIIIMSIITATWLLTFRFSPKRAEDEEKNNIEYSPFAILKTSIEEGVENIKKISKETLNQFKNEEKR